MHYLLIIAFELTIGQKLKIFYSIYKINFIKNTLNI